MIDSRSERRIVVTGIGVMSPIGRTVEQFWQALSGTTQSNVTGGGEMGKITDFSGDIKDFGELPKPVRQSIRKALKLMNRESQLAIAASQSALADSGVVGHHEPERIGISFGAQANSIMPQDFTAAIAACSANDAFDFQRWGSDGISDVEPLWILKCLPNMPACHTAIINDIRGHCNTITQRDTAANVAVAEACHVIKDDAADAVLVGATGTTRHPFNLLRARFENEIVEGEDAVCRPFDLRRVGPPPGEGSGAVVLEEMNAAVQRGAPIYGEIRGAAALCRTGSANLPKLLADVLRLALERGRLSAESFDGHLHAHGLGTRDSDIAEARAINEVFGEQLDRHPPLVAAKSHWGNPGTGSGAIELIASLMALKHGRLFPLLNYSEPDPDCHVAPVTSGDEDAGGSFLNLSFVSRGIASCVAVSTFEG